MSSWLSRRIRRLVDESQRSIKCEQGKGNEFGKRVWIDEHSVIGSYNYFGQGAFVTRSTIGSYCSIGNEVVIGPGEHDAAAVSTSAHFFGGDPYEALTREAVSLGSDVWIGTHAIVLRGVRVGTGAVIAANAVVTKSVEPYAIVAGVPARVLRLRFEPAQIEAILKSAWFDKDVDEAREIVRALERELKLSTP